MNNWLSFNAVDYGGRQSNGLTFKRFLLRTRMWCTTWKKRVQT